jgi:ABC-type Mn2+/Zn2+ transport system ATPase subunit
MNRLANKLVCINRTMFFHGNTQEFFASSELSIMQAHMRMHSDQKLNGNHFVGNSIDR